MLYTVVFYIKKSNGLHCNNILMIYIQYIYIYSYCSEERTHMNEPGEDLSFRVTVTANNAEQCVNYHRQPMSCGKDLWAHLRYGKSLLMKDILNK